MILRERLNLRIHDRRTNVPKALVETMRCSWISILGDKSVANTLAPDRASNFVNVPHPAAISRTSSLIPDRHSAMTSPANRAVNGANIRVYRSSHCPTLQLSGQIFSTLPDLF